MLWKVLYFFCRTLVNLPYKLRHSSTNQLFVVGLPFPVFKWIMTALVLFKWILSCEKGDPSLRFLFPELITHKLQLAGQMTAQLTFLHSQWEPHYLWFAPARTYFVKFSFRWKTPYFLFPVTGLAVEENNQNPTSMY